MIARTATGIDAETVIPTLRKRYSDDAPKTIPSIDPSTTAENVNSGNWALSGNIGMKSIRARFCPDRGAGWTTDCAGADMYSMLHRCEKFFASFRFVWPASRPLDRGESIDDVAQYVDGPPARVDIENQLAWEEAQRLERLVIISLEPPVDHLVAHVIKPVFP